jgi:hypothetical protein
MARWALASVVLAVSVMAASAGAGTQAVPRLELVGSTPVVVRGAHFHPGERVRVTATTSSRHVASTRTTAAGSFRVAFSELYVGRCATLRVVAVGSLGDTAHLKALPLPACISQ